MDCGMDFTAAGFGDGMISDHLRAHREAGGKGGYYTQFVTRTIPHPAVTEEQWVVDQEARDEVIVIGQRCSICGETK